LETARKTLADLRRVWGLDAPQQIAVRDGDPLSALSEAELLERIAEQDALIARIRRVTRRVGGPGESS
jgi:hypothetical protein